MDTPLIDLARLVALAVRADLLHGYAVYREPLRGSEVTVQLIPLGEAVMQSGFTPTEACALLQTWLDQDAASRRSIDLPPGVTWSD